MSRLFRLLAPPSIRARIFSNSNPRDHADRSTAPDGAQEAVPSTTHQGLDAMDDAALFHLGRFQQIGQMNDLDTTIALLTEVVRHTLDDDPERLRRLLLLAMSYSMRFERLNQLSDLSHSISTLEDVLPLCADDHARAGTLNNYGHLLRKRFERLGSAADVDKAVAALEEAVQLTPDDPHTDKPNMLGNLSAALRSRYERLGNLADLDRSIVVAEDALKRIPDDHPNAVRVLNSLGASLETRFERQGDLDDVNRSITVLERVLRVMPDEHPDRSTCLNHLGGAFLRRFERLDDLLDINMSVTLLEQSSSLAPDDTDKTGNLGHVLSVRFRRLQDVGDIHRSISLLEDAVRRTPEDNPGRASYQGNLSQALVDRFQLLGDIEDIDRAVANFEDVVRLIPKDNPQCHIFLGDLASCFQKRYERLGDPADLKKVISGMEDALAYTPDGHPHKPIMLGALGGSLIRCFELSGDAADIDSAISVLEEALQLVPDDHAERPGMLSNLCSALSRRFESSGNLEDLHGAISRYEDAIGLLPEGHPYRPGFLTNLSVSLRQRFLRLSDKADIDKAISVLEEAVRLTPDEHPVKAYRLHALGFAVFSCLMVLHDFSLLPTAQLNFSLAARSAHGSSAVRFDASRGWMTTAQLLNDDALEACELAIRLLPQLAWIGLSLKDRHHVLEEAAEVARDAAAIAIGLGRTRTAVEWLEQGRSIIWTQLLQLRTPLDELREKHPEIAERLLHVSKELERVSTGDPLPCPGLTSPDVMSPERQARRHRALAKERDDLLAEVRSLPGFEQFLLPKPFSQLVAAAHSGPVVILNASRQRCDALIVTASGDNPLHVPLPDITFAEAMALQGVLKVALESGRQLASVPESDRAARIRSNRPSVSDTFEHILSILWKKVVCPVLEGLGYLTLGDLRRVYWCPTGPFVFLPIHAAGLYDTNEPGAKVSDFVISSYTPTLGVLVLSPKDQISPTSLRILAVLQPNSDGQAPLPGARREIAQLQNAVDALSSPHVTLLQSTGTVDDVLAQMAHVHWVHFACHGTQDPNAPLDSGLILASGRRLRLSDIIQLSEHEERSGGGLAFLSACQTATGDRVLSEEAVHLVAGMLLAGYRSVIATTWSIGDNDAPEVAQSVYEQLFDLGEREKGDEERLGEGQLPDARGAARALHMAVARLRARGAPFASWVPFVHFGL